ncbi:carbonic anhydrase 14 [Strongylocentrotus purpuratus]|uniref:Carbonic anhydrase n=1 Tax=Strongylocentrotus purpuratus TaxID=7668 RepID=A0A7M7STB8_STRPU|nr:carbonic anhydrase 14 [Strongylocentrotus purpuratus]
MIIRQLDYELFLWLFFAGWSYNNDNPREEWHLIPGSYCNGTSQSPININTSIAIHIDLGSLSPDGYTEANPNLEIVNNGHGITVQLHEAVEAFYTLSGGGLPTTYTASQFHFHWGSINSQGSEHLINSNAFPAELHMVHYDRAKYANLGAALTSLQWDAVTAVGVMIQIGEDENTAFKSVLDYVSQIANYSSGNTSLSLPSFSIRSVLPFDLARFYRYNGSLTVPNCYESVIWNVLEEPISISQAQLDTLRNVYGDTRDSAGNYETTVNNYRLVNPLNDRTLYYSRPEDQGEGDETSTPEPTDGGAVAISPMRALFIVALALCMLFNRF